MVDIADIPKTPKETLNRSLLDLCNAVDKKRARIVIDHIFKHGIVTTEDLKEYGYDHQPRAVMDVKDFGIPILKYMVTSRITGRPMAAYTFDNNTQVVVGRVGGRQAFPKALKEKLIETNGSVDALTHEFFPAIYLQIDHRIPYQVSRDDNGVLDPSHFMLLTASSNRKKSWACEHCPNFLGNRSPDICGSCYWAFPEQYTHIAGQPCRRVDIAWLGQETTVYDSLSQQAKTAGIPLSDLIKRKLSE